jgi:hypothetical protein
MALPAHRVIAHREYGNTPPGGWPGRKGDPVYDMNWRRQRVAAFQPQQQEDVMNADQERMLREVHAELTMLRQSSVMIDGKRSEFRGTLGHYAMTADTYGWHLRNEDVPALRRQLDALSAVLAELANRPIAAVDTNILAAQLAPHLANLATALSDEDLARVARAVNDERDRRERDNNPATGATT